MESKVSPGIQGALGALVVLILGGLLYTGYQDHKLLAQVVQYLNSKPAVATQPTPTPSPEPSPTASPKPAKK